MGDYCVSVQKMSINYLLYIGIYTVFFLRSARKFQNIDGSLNYQDTLGIICLLDAEMLNVALPVVAKIVYPQAVFIFVDYLQEFILDFKESAIVHVDLKN